MGRWFGACSQRRRTSSSRRPALRLRRVNRVGLEGERRVELDRLTFCSPRLSQTRMHTGIAGRLPANAADGRSSIARDEASFGAGPAPPCERYSGACETSTRRAADIAPSRPPALQSASSVGLVGKDLHENSMRLGVAAKPVEIVGRSGPQFEAGAGRSTVAVASFGCGRVAHPHRHASVHGCGGVDVVASRAR